MTTRNQQQVSQPSEEGPLVACHRPARLRRPHSLTHSCLHLHLHARTLLVNGFLLYNSCLEPLCRTLTPRPWCLRLSNRVGPHIVGTHRPPAPAPVSEPSPAVHLAHSDPFARARIAAVQSRVAAPVLSDPRPPPPVPAFSPFRDGHYWCSKCPRRGFTTIPGLMRHVTHQHAGSSVGRGHLLLVRGDRTSHLHGSPLWWPQKNGRSGLQSMWTGQSGQAPSGG